MAIPKKGSNRESVPLFSIFIYMGGSVSPSELTDFEIYLEDDVLTKKYQYHLIYEREGIRATTIATSFNHLVYLGNLYGDRGFRKINGYVVPVEESNSFIRKMSLS